jgi:hypothetical protein
MSFPLLCVVQPVWLVEGNASLAYSAGSLAVRADLRYSAGGMPWAARKGLLKSAASGNPQRAPIAATGRESSSASSRSWLGRTPGGKANVGSQIR